MPKPPEKRRTDRLHMGLARRWLTKPHKLRLAEPIISFQFDDFPVSAVGNGADILRRHDKHGTFYLSTSLYGYEDEAGRYADQPMVRGLIEAGHCIGCHTHGHIDLLHRSSAELDADLECYERTFRRDFGGAMPRTFAYPYGLMSLGNKKYLARRFELARGIRSGINVGKIDLANLRANELAASETIEKAKMLIEENMKARGLLIFFTHDVQEKASPYGCTPRDFEHVVAKAKASGARILTMDEIADAIAGDRGE